MSDRRHLYTYVPRIENHYLRDRRMQERRRHAGAIRVLFIASRLWHRLWKA